MYESIKSVFFILHVLHWSISAKAAVLEYRKRSKRAGRCRTGLRHSCLAHSIELGSILSLDRLRSSGTCIRQPDAESISNDNDTYTSSDLLPMLISFF